LPDFFAVFQDGDPLFRNVIGRVTLEPPNFDRVAIRDREHGRRPPSQEDFGRADAGAARAEDGWPSGMVRAAPGHVARHDFLDESRDVDAGSGRP
jgi:hypothetical protein